MTEGGDFSGSLNVFCPVLGLFINMRSDVVLPKSGLSQVSKSSASLHYLNFSPCPNHQSLVQDGSNSGTIKEKKKHHIKHK